MRVILEPELEYIKWETHLTVARLSIHNLKPKANMSSLMTYSEWFIIMFVDMLASVAAGVTFYRTPQSPLVKVVTLTLLVGWLVFIYRTASRQEMSLRRGGVVETDYEDQWKQLKAAGDHSSKPINV